MKYLLPVVLAFLSAVLFSACTSLQKDLSINSPREQMEKGLVNLEELIIPLEAMGGNEVRRQQSEIRSARRAITDMEKETAADTDYAGQLAAWSGRLAILEGRYSDAQRLYRQAMSLSPGNVPALILGIRLEGDPAKRLELAEQELALQSSPLGFGALHIEKARSLLELRRFAEASGAFDTAFTSGLDAVYRSSYGEDRDRAWELRNFTDTTSGSLGILQQGSFAWKDCIAMVVNETQLLRFITGGRNISDTELFNRLLDRAFIPYTQDITVSEWPTEKPKPEAAVSRSGAAWFVWHLYAESRADRGLLSRYSARYASGPNPRSPIADVPPLSPFFDAILGCVETELMSLPDGRNFKPDEPIRATEFLTILQKIN